MTKSFTVVAMALFCVGAILAGWSGCGLGCMDDVAKLPGSFDLFWLSYSFWDLKLSRSR